MSLDGIKAKAKLRAHARALGLSDEQEERAVELAETLARERPLTLQQAYDRIRAQLQPRRRRGD